MNQEIVEALKQQSCNSETISSKDNNIISVIKGNEEFGSRALGNRSIIADPSNINVVETINRQIKNRDFWMPFALSILYEKHQKFIKNKKNILSEFMTIGFDTVQKNFHLIKPFLNFSIQDC